MHPACQPIEQLQKECRLLTGRRTGPGGQNRNKVETAVRLQHLPTGITVEASERRSQGQNRIVAESRLRLRLAVEFRSPWAVEEFGRLSKWLANNNWQQSKSIFVAPKISELIQQRIQSGRLSVSVEHQDFPAILSEVLDHLMAAGWNHRVAAARLSISGSQIAKLLRSHSPALLAVNRQREILELPTIK